MAKKGLRMEGLWSERMCQIWLEALQEGPTYLPEQAAKERLRGRGKAKSGRKKPERRTKGVWREWRWKKGGTRWLRSKKDLATKEDRW